MGVGGSSGPPLGQGAGKVGEGKAGPASRAKMAAAGRSARAHQAVVGGIEAGVVVKVGPAALVHRWVAAGGREGGRDRRWRDRRWRDRRWRAAWFGFQPVV